MSPSPSDLPAPSSCSPSPFLHSPKSSPSAPLLLPSTLLSPSIDYTPLEPSSQATPDVLNSTMDCQTKIESQIPIVSPEQELIAIERHRQLREQRKTGVKALGIKRKRQSSLHPRPSTSTSIPTQGQVIWSSNASPDLRREQLDQLDREIRWNCFIFHDHCFMDETIRMVYGESIPAEHPLYRAARTRFMDMAKAFKKQVLDKARLHVISICQQNPSSNLSTLHDKQSLSSFFLDNFSPTNFFRIWAYMKKYFDLHKSHEIAVYWCKSLYVNICTVVKMCTIDKPNDIQAHKDLLLFYDALPTATVFETVCRGAFFELSTRVRIRARATILRGEDLYDDPREKPITAQMDISRLTKTSADSEREIKCESISSKVSTTSKPSSITSYKGTSSALQLILHTEDTHERDAIKTVPSDLSSKKPSSPSIYNIMSTTPTTTISTSYADSGHHESEKRSISRVSPSSSSSSILSPTYSKPSEKQRKLD